MVEKSIHTSEYHLLTQMLTEARRNAKVTQIELGERLDTQQVNISNIERRERRIDLVEMCWWCDALGVDVVEFVRDYNEARLKLG